MIATHIVWAAAGRPLPAGHEVAEGMCYWCASSLSGLSGVPVAIMPGTFLDACGREAGSPGSTHLCAACAWTLSDAVRLPARVGALLLARALYGDQEHPGRVSVAVGDEAPAVADMLGLAEMCAPGALARVVARLRSA